MKMIKDDTKVSKTSVERMAIEARATGRMAHHQGKVLFHDGHEVYWLSLARS